MLFGCAEDRQQPAQDRARRTEGAGIKFVSINPVRTGYSAIADEWLGIRPGTDGLFVLALVHELLRAGRIDVDYLIRYTNAPWLVIQDRGLTRMACSRATVPAGRWCGTGWRRRHGRRSIRMSARRSKAR